MIFIYGIIAIFIAWIWVDYYRLIDVFESEKLRYFIVTFFLGAASVFLAIELYKLLDNYYFGLNGEALNDFLYSVFGIGLIEELAKTIPFIIVLFVFKKQFNEPIDYLAFICIAALGFSAAENVMYFQRNGPQLINGRSILSTVGHMFDTSLIAYGIIRYRYVNRNGTGILGIILFLLFAALSHGFYDFWLLYEGSRSYGFIVTIFYFLVTISIFSTILNNALNNSPHFSYKKVIDSDRVAGRLLMYYAIVFAIQFVFLIFIEDFQYAIFNLLYSVAVSGLIIVITILRLSRFKLIQNRWFPVKIELPFYIGIHWFGRFSQSRTSSRFMIRVKGDAYNETEIHQYYREFAMIYPVSKRNSQMGKACKIYIEQKIFTDKDEALFVTRIYDEIHTENYEIIHLRAKTENASFVDDKYPIVSILRVKQEEEAYIQNSIVPSLYFQEWVYIVPLKNQANNQ